MASRVREVRSKGWPWVVVAAAYVSFGCTVDDRRLSKRHSVVPPDGGEFTDGGGGGLHVVDAGDLTYDNDSGAKAPKDAGRKVPEVCLHLVDGVPDCDKTLADNADFNTDIAGWDGSAFSELRWVAKDSQGAKGSGSIAVKNSTTGDLDGLGEVAATQCFDIEPGRTYDYLASAYIKSGQVDYGVAQFGVWFYEQARCEGRVQQGGAYALSGVQATNAWLPLAASLSPVATSKSMQVRLIVQKPFRSKPLEALFDAVRVTWHPSLTP